MKAFSTWTVLKHKPLTKHSAHFWTVEGSMPNGSTRRVMSLARTSDGRLIIHNGVALEESAMKEIEAWGTPAFLVVPNGFHRMDARIFKDRYPSVKVLCPASQRKKVEEVVPVDGSYNDFPTDPVVGVRHMAGTKDSEGVLTVSDDSGTYAVFNDLLMNVRSRGFPRDFMVSPTGHLAVPRIARWFLAKDKQALAADLRKVAGLPNLRAVVVSHGSATTANASAALEAAAAELVQ